ncbi:MAG: glycoside hydrolase family 25 protein [Bacteroidetes bacterium]|nr:glycoside hydrolase family 25 protein [Bacteroidota bacterium]
MVAAKKKSPVKKPSSPRKNIARKNKSKGWPIQIRIAIAGILLVLLSPFYYGYVLKFFSSTWRWVRDMGGNPHYHVYKNFGIAIPDKYKIHGIDVSYAQGHIDWQKVRAVDEDSIRVTFAFIKATEGLLLVDPYFQRNWREAAKAGIVCGAYHYFKPSKSGAAQAKFFLQVAKTEKGDLPMVVDVEELNRTSPEQMRRQLKDYIDFIQKKTKLKPIIYSGISFYYDYLKGYFDDNRIWIANYDQPETKLSDGRQWLVWQHSDKATITGINHVVDFDAFYGDSSQFQQLIVK